MNSDVCEAIMSRVLDGEASAEEFAELERHLEESAEARARFVEHVDLHNILGQRFSVSAADVMAGHGVVPMDLVLERQRRRSVRSSVLAAAALLVFLGIVFKLVLVPEPDPLLSFRAAPDSVLSISHLTSDDKVPAPGTLAAGSRLQLAQGTVELTLATGVVSIVQAPADLTLHNQGRLHLERGTAWFRVPKGAEGFQVQTPDMLVTDLGTEFGVISTSTALDEVHVFKGRVEIRNRNGLKNSELLAGGAARVAGPAGRLVSIPVRSQDFLTSLPPSLPHVHLSFDSIEGDLLVVGGTHPDVPDITARLVPPAGQTPGSPLVSGRHGQALELTGQGDFVLTDWPGISGKRARTVSCWVRMPADVESDPAAAIVGWGYQRDFGKWKIHAAPNATGQGRFARISLGTTWHFTEQTRLDDDQWHHLVAVSYARTLNDGLPDLAIFIDGRREALSAYSDGNARDLLREVDTVTYARDSVPVLVGKGLPQQAESFRGTIDDLYIFDGALTDESIRQLAAGKPLNDDQ